MSSSRYLTMNQLYELTGVDRRTIKKRLEGLNFQKNSGKGHYYDAHEALPRIYQTFDNKHTTERAMAEESLLLERARREKVEIEVKRAKGEYIPIEDVVRDVEQEYNFIRNKLKSLGARLAQRLSLIDDPHVIRHEIDEEMNNCLVELNADERYKEAEREILETRVDKGSTESPETETDSESSPMG